MKAAIYTLVLVLAGAAIWFQLSFRSQPLLKYKAVPDFQLTGRDGKPVRLEDLKGKIWLADFIYTTCPGPCPMLSSHFSDLQQELLKFGDVRLVSISINPDHDTPEVLRQYAQHFHAADNWWFLTGPKQQVRDLVTKGFMMTVIDQEDGDAPIVHATKLVLVDRDGVIRAFYDGETRESDARIIRDVARLRRDTLSRVPARSGDATERVPPAH